MPYTFALPSITDLSGDQQIAFRAGASSDVLIISGCPGSGKTTVAMMRNKNRGSDPSYHYTVWANLLYGYLLNLSPQLNVRESFFSTFYSWFYSRYRVNVLNSDGADIDRIVECLSKDRMIYKEFQFDEAQDLDIRIRTALAHITEKYVICMDAAQDVNGVCDVDQNEIERTKRMLEGIGRVVQSFILKTNWRNTRPIFEFAQQIVPELNAQISVDGFAKPNGRKPEYRPLKNKSAIIDQITQIIQNEPGRNIGVFDDRLEMLHEIGNALKAKGIEYTIYDNREHRQRSKEQKVAFLKNMHNVVLATFISCKGLEFNTVVVADLSQMSDDLKKKKGYYVGCTRAQERLVILKDESKMKTPEWFQRIESSKYRNMSETNDQAPF